MPQITPIAANSNHPRLLTDSAYRQTPSRPRGRQAALLLALGVGEGLAAGADVDAAADVAAAADEAEVAGAVLSPPGAGDGVGSALPASVVPTPEPPFAPVPPPAAPAEPVAPGWPGSPPPAPAAPAPVLPGVASGLAAAAPPGITPPPAVGSVEPPPTGILPEAARRPAASGWPEVRGVWMTWIETADRARK